MNLRVLIAEDSSLFVEVLTELLEDAPGIEIAGVADNGVDAVSLCQSLRPDIVLMDIHMPRQDGLSATEEIMATCPTPILVITSDPHHGGVDLSFRALSLGALDLMAKPQSLPISETDRANLLRKIHLLSQIPVVRHVRGRRRRAARPTVPARPSATRRSPDTVPMVLGIVASTGGPRALARLCTEIPETFPGTLLIVQHITDGFTRHLARWLDKHSPLSVLEGVAGHPLSPGEIVIAPTGHHLTVGPDHRLQIDDGPPIGGHRPSGDRLLMSLAQHAPDRAAGLILSGMGNDGAAGLAALHRAGCPTLAQDEDTSVVYGMPRAAIEDGVVDQVLPDSALATAVEDLLNSRFRGGDS